MWDCEIDEILNTTLYNKTAPGFSIFDINSHQDGIDLYLFPDNPADKTGAGFAEGIGSNAFYLTGNNNEYPYGSQIKSHVLSHEMGHCLGLFHTHRGYEAGPINPELVVRCDEDEELEYSCNCHNDGDCLCDTEADPNLFGEVDYPSCTWTEQDFDFYDVPYNPSTNNIMSYSHNKCRNIFTYGQGERMKNVIATLDLLQACLVEEEVKANTTWDHTSHPSGVVQIKGNLIVESGATLTIESGVTVMFGRKSKLIIKPDAKVVLKGTLTSMDCLETCTETGYCGETWKGVEVWGTHCEYSEYDNPEECPSQFPENGVRAQGRFIGKSGSLVENAEVAVQLWGPDNESSGGIINCYQTTFKNNRLGIDFYRFHNYEETSFPSLPPILPEGYFGSLTECSFLNDAQFPHEENFQAFVRMERVKGPRFIGCTFINDTYSPSNSEEISDYGYGIYAINSEFSVRPGCNMNPVPYPCLDDIRSEFKKLGYGIYTTGFQGFTPYIVTQADFQDCFVGINNIGVSGGTMLHNKFFLGNLPSLSFTSDQIGIALQHNIDGMTLEENHFIGQTEDEINTIGTYSYNIGITNKTIRRNYFNTLNIGNEAAGICGNNQFGLKYECNFNAGNTEYDFLVCHDDDFTDQGIKKEQYGLDATNDRIAAGNHFSNTGTPPDRDFSNNSESILINYYHELGGGPLTVPDEYSGLESLIPVVENTCPQQYCNPPCRTPTELSQIKQEFYAQRSKYESDRATADSAMTAGDTTLAHQNNMQASVHRQRMDEKAYTVLIHALYDTLNYSRDTIYKWLENMDYFTADLSRAMDHLRSGSFQTGQSILDSAPSKFDLSPAQLTDLGYVQELFDLLSTQSVHDLSPAALDQLDTIAAAQTVYASGIAKSILSLYGRYFPPQVCEHDTELLRQKEERNGTDKLTVYPNPARDVVTFERTEPKSRATVVITDLSGKIIRKITFDEDTPQIQWRTAGVAHGIYFYRLLKNSLAIDYGRIIIQ